MDEKHDDRYVEEWDDAVDEILRKVGREATGLMILGMSLYFAAGIIFYLLFEDTPLTGIAIMAFFQVMVVYMATDRIYRCIKGGFLVGIRGQRDSVPALRRLGDEAPARLEQLFRDEMEKLRTEIRAERGRVEGELDEALEEGERRAALIAKHGHDCIDLGCDPGRHA